MEESCVSCFGTFVRRAKGFNRFQLLKVTTPKTAKVVFPALRSLHGFVCGECLKKLRKLGKKVKHSRFRLQLPPANKRPATPIAGRTPKRLDLRATPQSSLPSLSSASSVGDSQGEQKVADFKEKAINYLKRSQYATAFRLLNSSSKAARDAFLQVAVTELQHEIAKVKKGDIKIETLSREPTLEALSQFHWEDTVEEVRESCPWMASVLDAILPGVKVFQRHHLKGNRKNKRQMTVGEANKIRLSRLGLQMSIVLFSLSPKKYKLWQCFMGVELWRQTCTQKTFQLMSFLGLSQGHSAAINHVDKFSLGFDREMVFWRKSIEEGKSAASVKRRLVYDPMEDDRKGYSFCWDNVQWEGHRHHQGKEKGNTFYLKALAFAVRNRLPSMHMTDCSTVNAMDLEPEAFFPDAHDFHVLRSRMVVCVMRILANHLAALKEVKVVKHVPHQHTKELCKKSATVNLGVFNENPSSHEGVRAIMENLQGYCAHHNGHVITVICNGDGLSVDRMRSARERRSRTPTEESRLEGLLPAPQEFHKEALLMQDIMDAFFTEKSQAIPGTLYHVKEYFEHRSVKKKVLDNFQHVWDLLQFITQGFVLLLAMKITGISALQDTPSDLPACEEKRSKWLEKVSASVVEHCWKEAPKEDFVLAREGFMSRSKGDSGDDVYPFCSCKEDQGGPMVQCCNCHCPSGWFHWDCLTPPITKAPEDDWFCSRQCKRSRGYIYCMCQKRRGSQDANMVQCDLQDQCLRYEWYHPGCLGVTAESLPDIWYCSEKCEKNVNLDKDKVLQHCTQLLWEGLSLLAKRDMVREGDGPAMISTWKLDLLSFWNRGHTHYKLIAHNFLAYVAGVAPERLRHDLIWERVANIKGVPGKNVGLDLVNEFLNNDFKEMIKRSRGRYTDKQISRCSRLGGSLGKEVDRLFHTALGKDDKEKSGQKASKPQYKDDLSEFIDLCAPEGLFTYHEGRCPRNIPTPPTGRVKRPFLLGRYLKNRCQKLDTWRRIANETRNLVRDQQV